MKPNHWIIPKLPCKYSVAPPVSMPDTVYERFAWAKHLTQVLVINVDLTKPSARRTATYAV